MSNGHPMCQLDELLPWNWALSRNLFRLQACGQVLTCVRPRVAAKHMPRALMEVCGSGPLRLLALKAPSGELVFPTPSS